MPGVQSSLGALRARAGAPGVLWAGRARSAVTTSVSVPRCCHNTGGDGGTDVLRRQLQRLRELAELPNVSLRVLPFAAGASPAISCPFTLLYIERAHATIAYVETLTGSDYLRSTGASTLAFDHCQRDALSEEDTRILLDRRISDLE